MAFNGTGTVCRLYAIGDGTWVGKGAAVAFFEEVTDITPPNATLDDIEVSHMESVDYREYIAAKLADPGEFGVEMNYNPKTDWGVLIGEEYWVEIEYPIEQDTPGDNVRQYFKGSTKTYVPSVPLEDKATVTATFKVLGAITTENA